MLPRIYNMSYTKKYGRQKENYNNYTRKFKLVYSIWKENDNFINSNQQFCTQQRQKISYKFYLSRSSLEYCSSLKTKSTWRRYIEKLCSLRFSVKKNKKCLYHSVLESCRNFNIILNKHKNMKHMEYCFVISFIQIYGFGVSCWTT